MPKLSKSAVRKLRDIRDTADRWASIVPNFSPSTPSGDKPAFLIGRMESGPDSEGRWTGYLVRYDVNQKKWIDTSFFKVKFKPANVDETLVVGKRYQCRPSRIEDDGTYVFDTFTNSSQSFVLIDDDLGTGTWNLNGRSFGRVATYNVTSDSWTYSSYHVLIEPLNPGNFVVGRRYPAWFAGEDKGGFDGTGTGTLGTGTSSTVPIYLADPLGFKISVVTNVTVQCVNGNIVTTITRQNIIAILA